MEFTELRQTMKDYLREKNRTHLSEKELITLKMQFVKDGKECAKCGRKEMLTLDHIVPQSILEQLGVAIGSLEDVADNWQILCRPCNVFKANRMDFTHPMTKKILLHYINKL